jgi:hypothetical protein
MQIEIYRKMVSDAQINKSWLEDQITERQLQKEWQAVKCFKEGRQVISRKTSSPVSRVRHRVRGSGL